MNLDEISITNFRGIKDLTLDLAGGPTVLLGANGCGKTSILHAVALALGRERGVSRGDFTSVAEPIEIQCKLTDLGADVAGEFADQAEFGPGGPVLLLGARITIDGPDVELVCGFPDDGWVAAKRSALRVLPVISLTAERDATSLAALAGFRSLLAPMVDGLDIDTALSAAGAAVEQATTALASAEPLSQLFRSISTRLQKMLSDAPLDAFGVEGQPAADLLKQLELTLEYQTFPQPLSRQPSGLLQLVVFSVLLERLSRRPKSVVLLDEPETSLHPQAQRSLIGHLRASGAQLLIATHSADVLSRWDLRQIIRLVRATDGTVAGCRVTGIDDAEERRLARHVSGGLAEAFFARTAILVEGPGDRLSLEVFAAGLGINIDSAGVSIVELDGADLFATLWSLLGPGGLQLRVIGLCDADREASWAKIVLGSDNYAGDRSCLESHGVFVLDPDIEGALLGALSEARVEEVINQAGLTSRYESFCKQPAYSGLASREQLSAYVRHKRNKTVLPPLLAGALGGHEIPGPLARLIASV